MKSIIAASLFAAWAAAQQPHAEGIKVYAESCAACHGVQPTGTDRGPALVNSRALRRRSESQISGIIRKGTPGGMPAFPLPPARMDPLARYIHSLNASAYDANPPGDRAAGERFFFGKGGCSSCHMVRGRGGAKGPDLSETGRQLTVAEIGAMLDDPASQTGVRSTASCPGWAFCPQEPWTLVNVSLAAGGSARGFARAQSRHGVTLQTLDGKLLSLTEAEYTAIAREKGSFMPKLAASPAERRDLIAYLSRLDGVHPGPLADAPAPSPAAIESVLRPAKGEWPGYNGDPAGNRHSLLDGIRASNVGQLQLKWSYSIPYNLLETTPLVAEGAMYVTGPNQVCALDAASGREIWCFQRPRSPADKISGDAARGANRGVALLGDRVFFATDDARLIALNRWTGAPMWEVYVPSGDPGAYGSTAAPLVAGGLVITGVGGGDAPLRGFIAAYDAATGKQAWRFHTVPRPGEPGSETWRGPDLAKWGGGGATWLTGSYDVDTGVVYWPTGNPFPATDGDGRQGDNLYSNSVVALDAKTGKLRWHFQFTPHDLYDWDATEPLVLVDTRFQGRDRKLLLQANRSGFFYVLDRVTGEFLLGEPFVRLATWAKGIGKDGRPILDPEAKPTRAGVRVCPQVRGATNWYSTAFHPGTSLFYLMAVEDCSIYRQSGMGGYLPVRDPAHPPAKFLRALNVETGKVAWEVPQVGPPEANYSGVLSTAGGLVFYGETGGDFAAVDASTGKTLWHFSTGQIWKASPMTYLAGGRQHVAIAAGGNILSFALPAR